MAASPSVTERILRAAQARRGIALTPEETQELATLAALWGDVLTELDAFESRFHGALDAVEGRRARTAGVADAPPPSPGPAPVAAPVFACGGSGGAARPPALALALVHPW